MTEEGRKSDRKERRKEDKKDRRKEGKKESHQRGTSKESGCKIDQHALCSLATSILQCSSTSHGELRIILSDDCTRNYFGKTD